MKETINEYHSTVASAALSRATVRVRANLTERSRSASNAGFESHEKMEGATMQ
jgi:hypothetical protein